MDGSDPTIWVPVARQMLLETSIMQSLLKQTMFINKMNFYLLPNDKYIFEIVNINDMTFLKDQYINTNEKTMSLRLVNIIKTFLKF
jgi:hypothetical protein